MLKYYFCKPMDYELLNKLPVWCKNEGIDFAILCGGSRSAPLTLSLSGYDQIQCIAASDERSAGFIALGIAKATQKPVIIVTTSGSAVANLYPAVVEAFYQNIPLLIFTADREPNATEYFDGQAIQQEYIFGKHVKGFFQMSINISDPAIFHYNIHEAFKILAADKPGPLHINFPFKEPFYPKHYPFIYDSVEQTQNKKVLKPSHTLDIERQAHLKNIWNNTQKKLIICGFDSGKYYSSEQVNQFAKHHQIPIIADITSNINTDLVHSDLLIRNIYDTNLFAPDLIITIGGNYTSKVLKNYIHTANVPHHWHISHFAVGLDFFGVPTENRITNEFLDKDSFDLNTEQHNYYNTWQNHNKKGIETFEKFIESISFHELSAVKTIIDNIPSGSVLHLANSMAVRWANIIGNNNNLDIYCNRGTSGIDGCTSTAIGMAIAQPDKHHYLITGDMAFQYDNNALFNNDVPDNLTILILNNHGGNIFKLIDGPTDNMPIEKYFTNKHGLTFEYLAKHFEIDYVRLINISEINTFFSRNFKKIYVAEIIFSTENYITIFDQYKNLKF